MQPVHCEWQQAQFPLQSEYLLFSSSAHTRVELVFMHLCSKVPDERLVTHVSFRPSCREIRSWGQIFSGPLWWGSDIQYEYFSVCIRIRFICVQWNFTTEADTYIYTCIHTYDTYIYTCIHTYIHRRGDDYQPGRLIKRVKEGDTYIHTYIHT